MPIRWKPQTSLRWLAFSILVCALGMGWYRDHDRTEERIARMPGEIEAAKVQLADVTMRLAECVVRPMAEERKPENHAMTGARLTSNVDRGFPWSVEEFLDHLDQAAKQAEEGDKIWSAGRFRIAVFQLLNAPDEKFDQAFLGLQHHGEDSEPSMRVETLNFVGTALREAPERTKPFHSELIQLLLRKLSDDDPRVRGMSIECLQEIGPRAAAALEPLHEIIDNPADPWRVRATLAVAAIDETYATQEQLMELIRQRSHEWELAAWRLIEMAPAEQVEAFFREQFHLSETDDREVFAGLLNDLSLESMRKERESAENGD